MHGGFLMSSAECWSYCNNESPQLLLMLAATTLSVFSQLEKVFSAKEQKSILLFLSPTAFLGKTDKKHTGTYLHLYLPYYGAIRIVKQFTPIKNATNYVCHVMPFVDKIPTDGNLSVPT